MTDQPLAWETTVDPDELRDIARAETRAVYTATCREWHSDPLRDLVRSEHRLIREGEKT